MHNTFLEFKRTLLECLSVLVKCLSTERFPLLSVLFQWPFNHKTLPSDHSSYHKLTWMVWASESRKITILVKFWKKSVQKLSNKINCYLMCRQASLFTRHSLNSPVHLCTVYACKYVRQIFLILQTLSDKSILILKSNACLQSLCLSLGFSLRKCKAVKRAYGRIKGIKMRQVRERRRKKIRRIWIDTVKREQERKDRDKESKREKKERGQVRAKRRDGWLWRLALISSSVCDAASSFHSTDWSTA